jgi:hypothetical protein
MVGRGDRPGGPIALDVPPQGYAALAVAALILGLTILGLTILALWWSK